MPSFLSKTPNIIKRFAKYTIFSSSAFWFDLLLLFLLVQFVKINYLAATTGAFIVAHSVNYSLNRKWNFHETKEGISKSYATFITFGLLCLVFIVFSLKFVVENFHANYLLARIAIALFVGFVNFSFNYFISFKMGGHLKKDLALPNGNL